MYRHPCLLQLGALTLRIQDPFQIWIFFWVYQTREREKVDQDQYRPCRYQNLHPLRVSMLPLRIYLCPKDARTQKQGHIHSRLSLLKTVPNNIPNRLESSDYMHLPKSDVHWFLSSATSPHRLWEHDSGFQVYF